MLGLPDDITTCLFDLDGVLTQTAKVHAKAWKPRRDGVRSFLDSRGIKLPEGSADDPPDAETITFVQPAQAAVFEDAEAGVQAGRDGSFGLVVGVDRTGHAEALCEHGADVVVRELTELLERS
ncbi:MAG TPA: hypothetical protein VMJ65_28115 [Solirubrobacteraceae bacterium]|nr:hypothetical protein [Solirubrobacteraceae bacterium]